MPQQGLNFCLSITGHLRDIQLQAFSKSAPMHHILPSLALWAKSRTSSTPPFSKSEIPKIRHYKKRYLSDCIERSLTTLTDKAAVHRTVIVVGKGVEWAVSDLIHLVQLSFYNASNLRVTRIKSRRPWKKEWRETDKTAKVKSACYTST